MSRVGAVAVVQRKGGDSIIVTSSGLNPSLVLLQRDRAIGPPIAPGYQTAPRGGVESPRSGVNSNR